MRIRKMRGTLSFPLILLCLFFLGLTTFCLPYTVNANKNVKIVFWLFGSPTSEADKGLSPDKWYITNAIKRFEKTNPGIKVDLQVFPEQGMPEKFKAAGIAKNGPDMTLLWSGSMLTANKEFILPLDKYFSKDEIKIMNSIEAVREGYKSNGDLLGVPSGNDLLIIYYNKKLFKKAKVDEKSLPKDMDGFYKLCAKLKQTGITPLAIGDKDGYHTDFFVTPVYTSVTGGNGIRNIINGKTTFSKDPDWIASVKAYQELFKRGYTNEDVVSLDDVGALSKFVNGQSAMITERPIVLSACLKTLKNDLGVFKIPNLRANAKYPNVIVGGPGAALVVTKYSKHPNETVKFLKFLITKDELERSIKERDHGAGSTPYKHVSPQTFTDPISRQFQQMAMNSTIIPWLDSQMPQEVSAEFFRLGAITLTGKMSAEEYAKALDAKMQQVLKDQK